MTSRYIRAPRERTDDVTAAVVASAVAVGVGLLAFYFLRLLSSREELPGATRRAGARPTEAEE